MQLMEITYPYITHYVLKYPVIFHVRTASLIPSCGILMTGVCDGDPKTGDRNN